MAKGRMKRQNLYKGHWKDKITRFTVMYIIIIFVMGYLSLGLLNLQIIKGKFYKESVRKGTSKLVEEPAPRGNIYDKDGVLIAQDIQKFSLSYTSTEESDKSFYDTMLKVVQILETNNASIDDSLPIKLEGDSFKFEFNGTDAENKRIMEVMFKNDIGIGDRISTILSEEPEKRGGIFTNKYKWSKELVDEIMTAPQVKSASYYNLDRDEQKRINEISLKLSAEETYNYLKYSLEIPEDKFTKDVERKMVILKNAIKLQSYSGYKPVTIASSLERDIAFVFEQRLSELPGINVDKKPQRFYPFNEMGSAFIGTVGKISDRKYLEEGYDLSSDIRGLTGVEAAFEQYLRGSKGARIVEVNRFGRPIVKLAEREAYQGQNVHLTIDWKLQEAAEKAVDENLKLVRADANTPTPDRAAVVAINIKTGEVLAMSSKPGFNPNDFANPNGLTPELQEKYYPSDYEKFAREKGWDNRIINMGYPHSLNGKTMLEGLFPKDKNGNRQDLKDLVPKPTMNYVTQALIPPGSIFKPFTAYAGLVEGVISAYDTVPDFGFYDDGEGYRQTFPAVAPAGNTNLAKALQYSSNPYFMEISKRLYNKLSNEQARTASGIKYKENGIAKYAWMMGIGADSSAENPILTTGIEISENFGQVYNHATNVRITSSLLMDSILSRLKAGVYNHPNGPITSIPFDIIENSNDSFEVAALKKEIRTAFDQAIKEGEYSWETMRGLFQKLNDIDPQYKGRKLSEEDWAKHSIFLESQLIIEGYRQATNKANSYNAAIGQGITNVTPLQMASAYSTLLNGGYRYKLTLLDKVTDVDGKVIYDQEPEVLDKVEVSQKHLEELKKGMDDVVNNNTSLTPLYSKLPVRVAGKTGSADFEKGQENYGRDSFGWLATYAPAEDPEIVVVSVTFNGKFGSYNKEINYEILKAYFENK